jgi:hypothetical protein
MRIEYEKESGVAVASIEERSNPASLDRKWKTGL